MGQLKWLVACGIPAFAKQHLECIFGGVAHIWAFVNLSVFVRGGCMFTLLGVVLKGCRGCVKERQHMDSTN